MPAALMARRQSLGPQGTLNTGLTVHWHFDESSGDRAAAVGGITLTLTGTLGNRTGKLTNAVDFDNNTANYLNATTGISALTVTTSTPFEVCMWCLMDQKNAERTFMHWVASGSSAFAQVRWNNATQKIRILIRGQTVQDSTFGVPTNGVWFMVNVGDDGTNAFLIINNGPADTTAHAANGTTATEIRFGQTTSNTEPLDGGVDCPSIWNGRVLIPTERTNIYNGSSGLDYPYTL
jgi:hypothetical protein